MKAAFTASALCALAALLLTFDPVHRLAERSAVPPPGPTAPVRLRIPALGLDAPVLALALDDRGRLEVPEFEDAMKVGWYRLGPRPGQPGPAVLVGHRDAPAEEGTGDRDGFRNAVFARLGRVGVGDLIEAERADGQRLHFTVTGVETYRTDRFPTDRVYGPVPGPELRLITCGGAIGKNGHWDSNIVVSASLSTSQAARSLS
ncbi:class F sortase [Streptomyces sp. SYSU K217416]